MKALQLRQLGESIYVYEDDKLQVHVHVVMHFCRKKTLMHV